MQRRDALKRITWGSGAVLSVPTLTGLMSSCQVESGPDWTPAFFTPEQAHTVAEIAETIIPATDTPGAKDALVERYIDIMLQDIAPEAVQQSFAEGLVAFESTCREKFGAPFAQLSAEQKTEALKGAEASAKAQATKAPNTPPFFSLVKQMTLAGYFTSEPGATQALAYVAVPGSYDGCLPLEEGQKAWAI